MQMILREVGDIEWTHSKLFRTLTTDLQKGLASLAASPPTSTLLTRSLCQGDFDVFKKVHEGNRHR